MLKTALTILQQVARILPMPTGSLLNMLQVSSPHFIYAREFMLRVFKYVLPVPNFTVFVLPQRPQWETQSTSFNRQGWDSSVGSVLGSLFCV